MNRFYEERLPEGYTEALVLDANDKVFGRKLQIAASIAAAVLISGFFFVYGPRMKEILAGFTVIRCAVFFISYFLYIVLHELTHGMVYKIFTRQKLTFGWKPPAAYCGVPGIYLYRITSLLSLLAPFTIFTAVFAVLFFTASDLFVKTLVFVMFALHISGCTGDLYSTGLFLFRFKSPATLRKDTGPKLIYFTKDG